MSEPLSKNDVNVLFPVLSLMIMRKLELLFSAMFTLFLQSSDSSFPNFVSDYSFDSVGHFEQQEYIVH
jgi:hypothetical protein